MAKARTATVVLDEEPTAPEADPLDGIDNITAEEANQAFAITDELRGTAGVTLQFTRVWPNTPGVVGHCGEMAAEEFTLAEASRRYGPGRYVVRLRGVDNRYMKGGGKLNIAGNPTAAGPAPSHGGNSDMVQLLEAMNRRQEDRERADAARSEKFWALALAAIPTIPAIIAGFKGGGSDLTALVSALKPAPAPSMAEVVTTLQGLKALGNDRPPTDPLEQLAKLMEIAKGMSGNGDGDSGSGSNWMDIVRDVLKSAPEALAAMRAGQPQSVPVIVQQPGAAPTPQLQSAPTQPPQEGQDMWMLIQPLLRKYAANIEEWARENKNPELRAEVLLDDLPDWLANQLKPEKALELLNHPQWFEHLSAFHPPLKEHMEYCVRLRNELVTLVSEQIKENAEAPGGGDDGSNN